jgi:SpoVK/Ycf46/Vps4 family AAA+-type ATPase
MLKQRVNKTSEYKISDVINNQKNKLTLEYFLNILQGTLTMDNSVFIVTTNFVDEIDEAFKRPGRFDMKMELKKCNRYQMRHIYEKMMNNKIPENILNLIPEDTFTPAEFIYHIKNYIFDTNISIEDILIPFIKT